MGDEAPTDNAITDYDQMLFVAYLRLLDAAADRLATWEVCRIVLRIDPAHEPARARWTYNSYMARVLSGLAPAYQIQPIRCSGSFPSMRHQPLWF